MFQPFATVECVCVQAERTQFRYHRTEPPPGNFLWGREYPKDILSPQSEFPRKISPPLVKILPPRTEIISKVQIHLYIISQLFREYELLDVGIYVFCTFISRPYKNEARIESFIDASTCLVSCPFTPATWSTRGGGAGHETIQLAVAVIMNGHLRHIYNYIIITTHQLGAVVCLRETIVCTKMLAMPENIVHAP